MAIKQSRRTVSISRPDHTRLTEYAANSGVPASQLTEYALDRLLAEPLDVEAFRTWRLTKSAAPIESAASDTGTPALDSEPAAITEEQRARWREIIQSRMRGREVAP